MIKIIDNCLHLHGNIDFANVTAVQENLQKKLATTSIDSVSFAHVESCDTAALALLLALSRQCSKPLRFIALPDKLKSLIQLSDCQSILDIT